MWTDVERRYAATQVLEMCRELNKVLAVAHRAGLRIQIMPGQVLMVPGPGPPKVDVTMEYIAQRWTTKEATTLVPTERPPKAGGD